MEEGRPKNWLKISCIGCLGLPILSIVLTFGALKCQVNQIGDQLPKELAALKEMGVPTEPAVAALPAGYATVIGGRGHALSDGQRQRLGLARLFLSNPRILVLDEAFSALDLDTEARVRENLWQAFADRTALVVSHRPVGLAEFDRILFLHDGRFTAVAPAELRALLNADQNWTARPLARQP